MPREDETSEFMRAHRATSPEVPSFLHFYSDGMSLSEYLNILADWSLGKDLPLDRVPETFLFAFVGPRVVGRAAIRHALNAFLERQGGHIGFVVVPEFRRRGYATQILDLALRLANEQLGINPVLVTCDDSNIGSIRAIERNGGVLQDVIGVDSQDEPVRRYWIRAKPADASHAP